MDVCVYVYAYARDHSSIVCSDFYRLFFTILPGFLLSSSFSSLPLPREALLFFLRVYDNVACSASLLCKRLDCLLVRYTYHRADIVCKIILFDTRVLRRSFASRFALSYARARAPVRSCLVRSTSTEILYFSHYSLNYIHESQF